MNNDTNLNLSQTIDAAFQTATTPVTPTPVTGELTWANPEVYKQATGKRFRMTKQEQTDYGDTNEGRQRAFESRVRAGLLS